MSPVLSLHIFNKINKHAAPIVTTSPNCQLFPNIAHVSITSALPWQISTTNYLTSLQDKSRHQVTAKWCYEGSNIVVPMPQTARNIDIQTYPQEADIGRVTPAYMQHATKVGRNKATLAVDTWLSRQVVI
jgi:hypothetical protein